MSVVMGGPTSWQYTASMSSRPLGSWMNSGYLICKNLGLALVVAPVCTEAQIVTPADRFCAVTYAASRTNNPAGAPCGWFLPTAAQLQVGYNCRQYWDTYTYIIGPGNTVTTYWASDCPCAGYACYVDFYTGASGVWNGGGSLARAFRCVTY